MLPMAVLPRLPYKENFYFRGISKMSLLGRSEELPVPRKKVVTGQFSEYVELKPEMGEPMERLLDYWKARLTGAPALELPTDSPRSAVASFRGDIQHFSLPPDLVSELKELSRRENVTLFMTLAAAFQVLLQRYSGQDDIVMGTLGTGRSRLEPEGFNGLSTNTLVLRANLSGNPSFRALLAQVREVTLGAYAHQYLPFDKLVEALSLPRGRNLHPLFQVMFIVRSVANDKLQVNEIAPELLKAHTETAQFDLILDLSETPQGWEGSLGYAADLFEAATVARLIGHFQTLLEGIIARPEARLSELPLLTESERRQLLVEWNDTQAGYPKDKCIHQLFEEQVARSPDAIALIFKDQRLSYQALNRKANQLAHYLKSLGVGPDTLVAVNMDRSIDLVISLLAIIKAGGAYVPLDPTYPPQRLTFMLDDAKAQVILTHSSLVTQFQDYASQLVCFDKFWINLDQENTDNLRCNTSPSNLAYVIYTSGSTGQPKGVMVPHKALVNHMLWMQDAFPLAHNDKVLQKTPFGFDASVWEFFAPIISGAQLILAEPEMHKDASMLVHAIKEQAITVVQFVPSILDILKDCPELCECTNLKRVFCGGEALNNNLLQSLFAKLDISICNLYGPTEACIDATYWHCNKNFNSSVVPIGRPIYNTEIYILDPHLQPVPIGVIGEIYIGGDGLARGYLNRPELTAEKFISHSFNKDRQTRLYKTGDLARYLPDGTIEFLGRIDSQVKVRGFRIELGEIESVLELHTQIRDGAVGVYEPVPGDKRLVAYLVAQGGAAPALSELQDFLKQQLPEFMIPSAFVFLDELPLTPNGKLDRNALPMPDMNRQELDVDFIAPRSQVEKALAEIWCDVLRVNRAGIHDNFFDLGGQSLLATQVITRVSGQLSVEIPLATLFEMPTIADLAKLIENTRASAPNDSSRIIPQRRSAYKTGMQ
jgi:amino acid adenylation domain-containing protein